MSCPYVWLIVFWEMTPVNITHVVEAAIRLAVMTLSRFNLSSVVNFDLRIFLSRRWSHCNKTRK